VIAEAAFRANWTKLALKYVKRLPPAERDAVLEVVGASRLGRVRSAGVFEWLPASIQMSLVGAIERVLDKRAPGFWRDLMLQSFERSLLRPLIDGGLRVFGKSPLSLLRLTPQAYSLIARNCGTPTVTGGERGQPVRLRFEGLPPELRTTGWVGLCSGQCEAVLVYLGLQGSVTAQAGQLGDGCLVILTASEK
jgi:hypothetical protein